MISRMELAIFSTAASWAEIWVELSTKTPSYLSVLALGSSDPISVSLKLEWFVPVYINTKFQLQHNMHL